MAAALHDVGAGGVAGAEARRDPRAARARDVDLPAVGVAGKGEGGPVRHAREDVGVVGEEEDGGFGVLDGFERSVGVGDALGGVADAGDVEPGSGRGGVVLEDGDAVVAEGLGYPVPAGEPVVVAEDGDDAAGCFEVVEAFRHALGRDLVAEVMVVVDVVAEEDDEIGPRPVHARDDVGQRVLVDLRRAGVEVRDDGDG
ncbi:MAG TPA: hypothetical protein VNZ62_12715 [Capillimicrobium sp.]|nr:hypothetical protein [Capillimicrobium sp.]